MDSADRKSKSDQITYVAFPPKVLRNSALVVIALFVLLQVLETMFSRLAGFLVLILLAWLLAIAMEPAIGWMTRHGLKRGSAAGLSLLGVILTTIAFLVAFGGVLFAQLAELIRGLPDITTTAVSWLNKTFDLTLDPQELVSKVDPSTISNTLGGFAGGIVGVVNAILAGLISILTLLFFTYYIAAEGPALRRTIGSWLPHRQQEIFVSVWDTTVQKTGGFVVSKLVLAAFSAAYHGALYVVVGVPYWLPMALFTGVVSQFIPTIGTYLAVLLPILFVVFDNPVDALIIVAFASLYQQIENLILSPRISKRTMDIHPAIALASVFIGAAAIGPIGAIVAIPLAAAVVALLDTYGNRYALIPELARIHDGEKSAQDEN